MSLSLIGLITLIIWVIEITLYVYHVTQIKKLKQATLDMERAYKEYKEVIESLPNGITKKLIEAFKVKKVDK